MGSVELSGHQNLVVRGFVYSLLGCDLMFRMDSGCSSDGYKEVLSTLYLIRVGENEPARVHPVSIMLGNTGLLLRTLN